VSTVVRTYSVAGMHCSSCAISIDWELEDLEGVTEARTSYAHGQSTVVFDPDRVSEDDVLAAIARAGFQTTSA
jgi:copper chaperone CopZ